ncbi:MAG: endopeptidase La [Sedimentisphaeraceae bacterium JB056]
MRLLDIDDFDTIIGDDGQPSPEQVENMELPETMCILPVRNAVAFPGTVIPLALSRDKSQKLLDECNTEEDTIGLVTQKKADIENPGAKDIYNIGTAASILKVIKSPQGPTTIIVHGIMRFRIDEVLQTEPFIKAKVSPIRVKVRETKKLRAVMVNVKRMANKVISLSPNAPEEAMYIIENINDASALADFVAATLNVPVKEKQAILNELDPVKRLDMVSLSLANQTELLELSNKIHGQVRSAIDKTQREYFLQEQLKAIQNELGQNDRKTEELNTLAEKVKKAKMPKEAEKEVMRELERLGKIHQASPEYSVIRTYIDWACELPWSKKTEDSLDIDKSEKTLNADHYGLEKVKKRILEFLAVRKLNPTGKSPILCFAGPPGVGKTSLGKSIARAMNREFVRISLGGIKDEADIRGHRRTYIGALPGRILQELRKCGSKNPVFMLDELDKIGQDFRGDPASALLEVLDPEQNDSFTDHYLDLAFDLSNIMFIGTANYLDPIPPALYDRMEIIDLPGYTRIEKLKIAKKYLLPRQIKENGLKVNQITFKDDALLLLIDSYTAESGVRSLEREIGSLCRNVATQIAKKERRKVTITKNKVQDVLGPIKYESEVAMRSGKPGIVTGLAWTPVGGEILFIESLAVAGKGELSITGQIGEVMEESVRAAYTLIKSMAGKYDIPEEAFKDYDYHIHVPAGAVPKDGPSAGVGMFTSLLSLIMDCKVDHNIAMTGEITLQGLVLPIGGLKEKILAAKQAGITKVILPARNKKDMPDVPKEAQKDMEFVFVKNVQEVAKEAILMSQN